MDVYYNDIDPFCCKVLRKQIGLGNLPQGFVDERDIREVRAAELAGYEQIHLFAGIGGIPLACRWAGMPSGFSIATGGFPCQPFSHAGFRAGSKDYRYLWPQMLRIVGEKKPTWVVGENVAGLISMAEPIGQAQVESRTTVRDADTDLFTSILTRQEAMLVERMCQDLEKAGYEVQPLTIPACAVNAPHRRDRLWIIGYANHKSESVKPKYDEVGELPRLADFSDSNAERNGLQRRKIETAQRQDETRDEQLSGFLQPCAWDALPESEIWGMDDGIPDRMDRNIAIGNAVVPQQVYPILKTIMDYETQRESVKDFDQSYSISKEDEALTLQRLRQ